MIDAFIGIDLAFAKRKRLPVSICTWRDGRLRPEPLQRLSRKPPRGYGNVGVLDRTVVRTFVRETSDYICAVCDDLGLLPRRIGIDAPRSPRPEGVRRRAAEAAMDQAGISCFTTPAASEVGAILAKVRRHLSEGGAENRLPHANQLWMLVGFELFHELSTIWPCIEVFPQATVRMLGAGTLHKFKRGGVEAQLAEVSRYTGWPSDKPEDPEFSDIAFGPGHDLLDAYLSAWVAALDESDRIPFGSPPYDVIWTPRVELAKQAEALADEPRANRTRDLGASHQRLCPVCRNHLFKRWPFGWDAHAAHRCTGLLATEPDERKREFKSRFIA